MVAIIDYDAGNIRSVEKAVSLLGEDVKVTRERGEILSADHIILPGVGAFGRCDGEASQLRIDGSDRGICR